MAAGTRSERRLRGLLLKGLLVGAATAGGIILGASAASADEGQVDPVQDTTAVVQSVTTDVETSLPDPADSTTGPADEASQSTTGMGTQPPSEAPTEALSDAPPSSDSGGNTADAGPALDGTVTGTNAEESTEEVTHSAQESAGSETADATTPDVVEDSGAAAATTDSVESGAATDPAGSDPPSITDTGSATPQTAGTASGIVVAVTEGPAATGDAVAAPVMDQAADPVDSAAPSVEEPAKAATGRDSSSVMAGAGRSMSTGCPPGGSGSGSCVTGSLEGTAPTGLALSTFNDTTARPHTASGTLRSTSVAPLSLLTSLSSLSSPATTRDTAADEAPSSAGHHGDPAPAPFSPSDMPSPGKSPSPTSGTPGQQGSHFFWLLIAVVASAVALPRNDGLSQLATGTATALSGRAALVQDRPG